MPRFRAERGEPYAPKPRLKLRPARALARRRRARRPVDYKVFKVDESLLMASVRSWNKLEAATPEVEEMLGAAST